MLLIEEMRRVLRFLEYRSTWWKEQEVDWEGVDSTMSDRLKVYALRQAAMCDSIAAHFQRKWAETDVAAVRQAAAIAKSLLGLGLEETIMQ